MRRRRRRPLRWPQRCKNWPVRQSPVKAAFIAHNSQRLLFDGNPPSAPSVLPSPLRKEAYGTLQPQRLLFERSCPRSGPRIVPTSRRRHSLPAAVRVLPAIAMAAVYGNPTEFSCFPLPIQKTAFGRTLRLSKKTLGGLGSARKTVNPPHYGGLFYACSENLLEVNGLPLAGGTSTGDSHFSGAMGCSHLDGRP